MGKYKRPREDESSQPKIQRRTLIFKVRGKSFQLDATRIQQNEPDFVQFLQQNNNQAGNCFTIDGIDSKVFDIFQRFFENDEWNVQSQSPDMVAVFNFAKKFKIHRLQQRCIQEFRRRITDKKVFWILDHAIFNNEVDWINQCIQFIILNLAIFIICPEFFKLRKEDLINILKGERQDIDEGVVFDAVVNWSEKECLRKNLEITQDNKRQVLAGVITLICFPRMRFKTFTDKVLCSSLVPQEVISEALCHFLPLHVTLNVDQHQVLTLHGPDIYVGRFRAIHSGKDYVRGNKDAMSFRLNIDALLSRIQVFGSHQRAGSYRIALELYESDDDQNERLLYNKELTLPTDGRRRIYDIAITPPQSISADRKYSIIMLMTGIASYFGIRGQSTVTTGDLSVTFLTNIEGLNGTTDRIGQFPGLFFRRQ